MWCSTASSQIFSDILLSAWNLSTCRSLTQGTRPRAGHAAPRAAGEATTRNRGVDGPTTTLHCQPLRTCHQGSEVRRLPRLRLEGLPYASSLKLQGHHRGGRWPNDRCNHDRRRGAGETTEIGCRLTTSHAIGGRSNDSVRATSPATSTAKGAQ
jgi:hypothetical protein